jgi:outer membrane protein assembly factor BamB
VHSRLGTREVVSCLRPDTGQLIWREGYEAPYTVNPAAMGHGKGVKSTPVVEGGRVYTFGINAVLASFDAASGKMQWRKDFSAPEFGTSMSPLVDGSLLIAHSKAGVAAFDKLNGTEKWQWRDDGPAYASPIIVELAGTRQLVTQTRTNIVSLSPATGELLWKIPFTTPFSQNIVTPVLYRDTLIFSGIQMGTMAVRVVKRGTGLAPETVWNNKEVSMYMNTPVVSGDLLFGLSNRDRGLFFCMDPRTGATLWTSGPRQGENAAIVDAGPALLLLTNNGELIVANKNGKAFEVLRKYTVANSPTWAHPVPITNGILIKDVNSLTLWGAS